MRALFIVFLIGLMSQPLSGQVTFVKGYLVGQKGDTLLGEVKVNPKKEHENYNKVFFKDANGVQKSYKPNKTKAYGFGTHHFRSMDSEGEPKFYQVLSGGAISFYKLMYEAIHMNEVTNEAEYYIAHADDTKKLVPVKEGKFKKQLTEWMKDNTEILSSYEDEKDFHEEKAAAVINQYNAWKAGQ